MPLQRQFTVPGHQVNIVYRFAATATNEAGTGPESAPRFRFYECGQFFKDTGNGCTVSQPRQS